MAIIYWIYTLDRLALSAEYFSYAFDEKSVRLELRRLSQRLESAHKVRILLSAGGISCFAS